MASLKYWIWLTTRSGVGHEAAFRLLEHFGTPEAAYFADPAEYALLEEDAAKRSALADKSLDRAEAIQADCARLGVDILTLQDARYPERLRQIFDPPCVLYVKGRLPAMDEEVAVGVVGARRATPYGIGLAGRLGLELARGGAVVVSGIAQGIDAAALRGALKGGGTPVSVLGNGVDVYFPSENRYLYHDVAAAGALVSEFPPGTGAEGWHFPVRNRIMSGLCLGTLVVEAPARSGALITAGTALEQGRDVFAVPGPIDAPASVGCNRLIRDGAGLVSDAWDILGEYEPRFPDKLRREGARETPAVLGYQARQKTEPKPVPPSVSLSHNDYSLTDDQICLLRALTEEPMLVDDLIELTDIPTRRVLSALTVLEIEHLVTQHSGKRYARAVNLTE